MLGIEDILCEVNSRDREEDGLPPGFRFHPTDEELITFYLASKVFHRNFSPAAIHITQVDLNRCEPWELPDVAKMGEREWYFFSLRDRKYPTGLRTNRATVAGYWKATGKDREVYSASNGALLGMKKTLVFYKGRAPRGEKTKWVMHEYRLDGDFSCRHTCKEEWVICRIYHKMGEKKNAIMVQGGQSYPTLKTLTSSALALPPLPQNPMHLHFPDTHNSTVFHHHENDLKSILLNHHPHPLQTNLLGHPINSVLSSSFSAPKTKNILLDCNSSILFKSQISNQDGASKSNVNFTATTSTVGPCKTEAAPISPCLISDPNVCWNNPIFYGMGMGMDASAVGFGGMDTFDDNRACSQMVNPPIQLTADSWPMDL